LSVTLPVLTDQTVLAGAPLNLALNGSDTASNALTYTVSVSNTNLTNSSVSNPQLTATIPQGNPTLRFIIDDATDGIHGEVDLQLFKDLAPQTVDKIMSLVNNHFYDGLIFHRVIQNFMIQGGDPNGNGSGGPGYNFDDEINSSLQFTSSGLLAMANSGSDTNGSQFFITVEPTRWLDFRYTIFGMLTEGGNIVQQITGVATNTSDKPLNNVVITQASIFTDTQNGVLRLSAPNGTTGTADVTVTATDSITGELTSQTFHVTVGADANNDPPFLGAISPIQTTANTPVSIDIPATDVEGDSIYYDGSVSPANANLAIQVDHNTGHVVITPSNGIAGVYSVTLSAASSSTGSFDSQLVPVYINPAAPSGIQLLPVSDTGSNNADRITGLNNSTGNTLQFQVNGVISGGIVQLFADGTLIGQATASSGSVIVTTNGTTTLTDGQHSITAKQTFLNQTVNVGNLSTTVDLASTISSALTFTIDTIHPQFNFTPGTTAIAGNLYTCQVATSADASGAVTYLLSQAPNGMTINSAGLINWTPTTQQVPSQQVIVLATDLAGNTAQQTFTINVLPTNRAPVLASSSPLMGITDEDTPISINLTGTFINNGTGTTSITDVDENAVLGGIALIDVSGHGTWTYSIDGTTFTPVGAVSPASALLLPNNATLRYTPDGKNGETAIISYRAWDTTAGVNGSKVDTTTNGNATAFSIGTDIATITVNAINDAPVIAPVSPSLGITTPAVAKTINLAGTFINHGTGTTTITDVDENAVLGGIALVGSTGNGTWEYSTDGTTFSSVGTISNNSALLLSNSDILRFTPNGTSSETATLTYRAWDETSGQNGGSADTTVNGGVTAFSLATDTASLIVNNAPILTAANPSLGTTNEDSAITISLAGTFINHGTGTTTIADANDNAVVGGIALAGTTGNGTWAYSTDGTTFTAVGTVSQNSALLLANNAVLRYTPDGKNGETATITYSAWDTTSGANGGRISLNATGDATAFSIVTDTASLTVTSVNDAPVLTPVPAPAHSSLGTTAPNAAKTISLTGTFINNGTGTTTITDVDNNNAVVGGIALTGVTGNGIWEYSTDGTTFTAVGAVSDASALLLAKDATLRYTPNGTSSETATITYRAWDTTTGQNGVKVDASSNGGVTAFSAATDTASLTVLGTGSLSGFVYVDADNDGQRITPSGNSHMAISGVVIKLLLKDSQGNWAEVAGKSPVMTASDGSYHFDHLVPGTYRIQEVQPVNYLDGKDTTGNIAGTARGTAGQDQIEIQIASEENGSEYNFGEQGILPGKISVRSFLVSAQSLKQILAHNYTQMFAQINTPPSVDLSKSAAGTGYHTGFVADSSPVAIAASDASVTDPDSPMLASMTVAITNLLDVDHETLSADVSNTQITSSYANGVLRLNGVAASSVYAQVLKTVKYSDTAASPQVADRLIDIVAYDGIASSQPARAKVTVAMTLAAIDQALQSNDLL
jgi:cyclophilin family peptidyl-prolyl cis-trans isomerase